MLARPVGARLAAPARRPRRHGVAGGGGLFLLSVLLSGAGLVAADWEDEVAVNYAPPGFVGPDPSLAALAAIAPAPPNAFDPLAADLSALKAELAAQGHATQP
jgi:hypothetical protein